MESHMEYSGFASRLDAAIYRSDIKVRQHLSQCGMDTASFGETNLFYAIISRETMFF